MTTPGDRPLLAMVGYETRRDVLDPLRFFQDLEVAHLYHRIAPNEVALDDVRPRPIRFDGPRELLLKLRHLDPDIVQPIEPFWLERLPLNLAVTLYVMAAKKPVILVSLANVPMRVQYGRGRTAVLHGLLRPLLKRARLLIYLNEGARACYLAAGAPPERMVRLMFGCWGVDLAEFSPGPTSITLRQRPGERVVLFVGRLDPTKGVFELLAAFRRIRASTAMPVRLVFAGAGEALDLLRRLVSRYGLDGQVDILGAVDNRQVAALMRAADVLVAPSISTRRWAEQVGMVLLQGMGCGHPVVTTRSGSIPEFVDDEVTGLLIPERAPDELSNALVRILSDNALRRQLAENGRRAAIERYDAAANVRLAERAILAACGGRA